MGHAAFLFANLTPGIESTCLGLLIFCPPQGRSRRCSQACCQIHDSEETMGKTRRNFIRLAGLGGGLCMTAAAHGSSAPNSSADFLTLFAKRCSVRRYKPDPVPEEDLRLILDAARRPPTAGNQQPWKFLVIKDRAKIERMRARCLELAEASWHDLAPAERASRKEAKAKAMAGYFSAPVYVVVLTDSQSTYPSYNQHDGPLA